MSVRVFLGAWIGFFWTQSLLASGLSAPIDLESTGRLPQGVRNIRYKSVGASVVEKYNETGRIEPLGASLNKELTYKDMAKSDDKTEETVTKSFLEVKGKNEGDSLGKMNGSVRVAKTAHVPVIAYGISSAWTAALVVPVYVTDVKINSGFVASESAKSFKKYLAEENFKRRTAAKMDEKLVNPFLYSAKENGYDEPKSETYNEVGDIKLVSKIKGIDTEVFNLGIKQTIVLPTGRATDPDKVIDVAPGDGQWDAGIGLTAEYKPFGESITLVTAAGYTFQAPANIERRVPEDEDSTLSDDKDSSIRMDLGDYFEAQVGAKFALAPGFSAQTGYSYGFKQLDTFEGTKYSNERYDLIGKNTDEEMQSVLLGVGYSTVPFFREKTYAIPWEMNASYAKVLTGKNVSRADLIQLEMAMFF